MSNEKPKLIIGIDVGTTRCVVTHALIRPNRDNCTVRVARYWETAYGQLDNVFPPTTLLYNFKDKLPITGFEVKSAVEDAFYDKDYEAINWDACFTLWKLLFHHSMGDPAVEELQNEMLARLQVLGKTKYDLVHDFAKLLYNDLINNEEEGCYYNRKALKGIYNSLNDFQIEVVVAVPPGRSVVEHKAIADAFTQGMVKEGSVVLESEPQAMFASWLASEEQLHEWKVGDRYLVVDGGGGTCCMISFRLDKIDPPCFKQERASLSLVCGGETITAAFMKLVKKQRPSVPEPNEMHLLDQIKNRFEAKCKFQLGRAHYLENGYLDKRHNVKLTYDEIKGCFEPCIDKILQGLRVQLSQDTNPEIVVLGGGLFQNEYITKRITKECLGQAKVFIPSTDKKHVAEGAILCRLYDNFFTGIIASESIGVLTMQPVEDNIKNSPLYPHLHLVKDPADPTEDYFLAVSWIIKKGEQVSANQELQSESTFKTARKRTFDIGQTILQFDEMILSVDAHPGDTTWTALANGGLDGAKFLINQNGQRIARLTTLTTLRWDLDQFPIKKSGLRYYPSVNRRPAYRVIRFSIVVHHGLVTQYSIKAYGTVNGVEASATPYMMRVAAVQSPFKNQLFSAALQQSFELGTGLDRDLLPAINQSPFARSNRSGADLFAATDSNRVFGDTTAAPVYGHSQFEDLNISGTSFSTAGHSSFDHSPSSTFGGISPSPDRRSSLSSMSKGPNDADDVSRGENHLRSLRNLKRSLSKKRPLDTSGDEADDAAGNKRVASSGNPPTR